MQNLSSGILISESSPYTGAGTSDVTGAAIDMAGYEGVIFIGNFGTAAANNTLLLHQSSDDAATDAYTEVLGTQVGVGAGDELVWLDIYRPGERYVKCIAERGTSTTLETVVAIRYGGRNNPEDNTVAGTIHGEQHASPIEGTA